MSATSAVPPPRLGGAAKSRPQPAASSPLAKAVRSPLQTISNFFASATTTTNSSSSSSSSSAAPGDVAAGAGDTPARPSTHSPAARRPASPPPPTPEQLQAQQAETKAIHALVGLAELIVAGAQPGPDAVPDLPLPVRSVLAGLDWNPPPPAVEGAAGGAAAFEDEEQALLSEFGLADDDEDEDGEENGPEGDADERVCLEDWDSDDDGEEDEAESKHDEEEDEEDQEEWADAEGGSLDGDRQPLCATPLARSLPGSVLAAATPPACTSSPSPSTASAPRGGFLRRGRTASQVSTPATAAPLAAASVDSPARQERIVRTPGPMTDRHGRSLHPKVEETWAYLAADRQRVAWFGSTNCGKSTLVDNVLHTDIDPRIPEDLPLARTSSKKETKDLWHYRSVDGHTFQVYVTINGCIDELSRVRLTLPDDESWTASDLQPLFERLETLARAGSESDRISAKTQDSDEVLVVVELPLAYVRPFGRDRHYDIIDGPGMDEPNTPFARRLQRYAERYPCLLALVVPADAGQVMDVTMQSFLEGFPRHECMLIASKCDNVRVRRRPVSLAVVKETVVDSEYALDFDRICREQRRPPPLVSPYVDPLSLRPGDELTTAEHWHRQLIDNCKALFRNQAPRLRRAQLIKIHHLFGHMEESIRREAGQKKLRVQMINDFELEMTQSSRFRLADWPEQQAQAVELLSQDGLLGRARLVHKLIKQSNPGLLSPDRFADYVSAFQDSFVADFSAALEVLQLQVLRAHFDRFIENIKERFCTVVAEHVAETDIEACWLAVESKLKMHAPNRTDVECGFSVGFWAQVGFTVDRILRVLVNYAYFNTSIRNRSKKLRNKLRQETVLHMRKEFQLKRLKVMLAKKNRAMMRQPMATISKELRKITRVRRGETADLPDSIQMQAFPELAPLRAMQRYVDALCDKYDRLLEGGGAAYGEGGGEGGGDALGGRLGAGGGGEDGGADALNVTFGGSSGTQVKIAGPALLLLRDAMKAAAACDGLALRQVKWDATRFLLNKCCRQQAPLYARVLQRVVDLASAVITFRAYDGELDKVTNHELIVHGAELGALRARHQMARDRLRAALLLDGAGASGRPYGLGADEEEDVDETDLLVPQSLLLDGLGSAEGMGEGDTSLVVGGEALDDEQQRTLAAVRAVLEVVYAVVALLLGEQVRVVPDPCVFPKQVKDAAADFATVTAGLLEAEVVAVGGWRRSGSAAGEDAAGAGARPGSRTAADSTCGLVFGPQGGVLGNGQRPTDVLANVVRLLPMHSSTNGRIMGLVASGCASVLVGARERANTFPGCGL